MAENALALTAEETIEKWRSGFMNTYHAPKNRAEANKLCDDALSAIALMQQVAELRAAIIDKALAAEPKEGKS